LPKDATVKTPRYVDSSEPEDLQDIEAHLKGGIPPPTWGIKRMKTKWGACNIEGRRIWLNLELIKKPPQCLEYIVVHEMARIGSPP
jgi:predicted metal-dependent hydrolase